MRKLVSFMMVSLDGYFEGPDHDISMFKNEDPESASFAVDSAEGSGGLIFGRKTYELMAYFWPTHTAKAGNAGEALLTERMNSTQKFVVSRTLKSVVWGGKPETITLLNRNVAEEIARLKARPGKDLTVLGSNTLCVSLLELGLLDEIQVMVFPVVIGNGTPLFHGIQKKVPLKLLNTRSFGSGKVLLRYQPQKQP